MSAPAPSPLAIVEAEPLPRQEEVLTDAALAFVAELHRRFTPRRDELLARRAERRAEIARTSTLDFLPETAAIRADDCWKVAPAPGRAERPPRRDHRPHRPQDDHQRAQLGRQGLARRLRGRLRAHLGERRPRPAQPDRRLRAPHRLHRRRSPGKSYALRPAEELATVVMRPRGWHLDERHLARRGPPGARRAGRLRPVLLPQRPAAARPRQGPVLLPARRPSRTWRPASGTTSSSSPRTTSASRRAPSAPPS